MGLRSKQPLPPGQLAVEGVYSILSEYQQATLGLQSAVTEGF